MNRASIEMRPVGENGVRFHVIDPATRQTCVGAELHCSSPDYRQVPRQAPQPWAEILPGEDGAGFGRAETLSRALLAEVEMRGLGELAVLAPAGLHTVLDELRRQAPGYSLAASSSWPPLAPPQTATVTLQLYRSDPDAPGRGPFGRSYREALLATEVEPGIAGVIERLTFEIEAIVEDAVADPAFSGRYGVEAVTAVGSSRRATYAALPVDFDVIVLTRAAHDQFESSGLEPILRGIVSSIEASATFCEFCAELGFGSPAQPPRLELGFLGLRGIASLVARFDVRWGTAPENKCLFLDISFGQIPRAVGYELWMTRFLDGLSEEHRRRLLREIRLSKRLLKAVGGLYDAPDGLRAHTIEQWLIQSRSYRCSGLEVGTLDNLLRLVAEEGVAGSEIMSFHEFKSRFPVWHPGAWEAPVVPPGQPGVNLLDFLGNGGNPLAQQKWATVVRLAQAYVRCGAEDRPWRLEELAEKARRP